VCVDVVGVVRVMLGVPGVCVRRCGCCPGVLSVSVCL